MPIIGLLWGAISSLGSLWRGALSSPRVFFACAIALALLVGGCEIDKRAVQRERAKWQARVEAAAKHVAQLEQAANAKIAAAVDLATRLNQEALDAQRTDTEALRAALGQSQSALARCRVPRAIVMRLDAGARALPGAPAAAGEPGSRTDPAVSRADRGGADRAPAGQPGAPADAGIDPAALLIRAREVSGAAERNTERLVACRAAYEAAREAAMGAGGR